MKKEKITSFQFLTFSNNTKQTSKLEAFMFVNDQSSLHNYRTELPNIIFDLGLDSYEFHLYGIFKNVAGDRGKCWLSNDELAKRAKMSDRHIRRIKKSLCKKGLITITFRKKEDGGPDTDLITIIDLWPKNFESCMDKKNKKTNEKNVSYEQKGVRTGSPEGADCKSGKEDLSKQEPYFSSTNHSTVHNSVDSSMKEPISSIPSCEQSHGSDKSTSNEINDLLKRYVIKDQWKIKPIKLETWKKYTLPEIETAIKYIFQQISTKGTDIENFEAYMEKALQGKWKPLSENALKNLKAAAFFKKHDRLSECLIQSNCCVNISTSKDLGFELEPSEFKKRFTDMFKRPWNE